MDEKNQQDTKEDKSKEATPAEDAGDTPKTPKIIDEANAAALRLETATRASREENQRTMELAARKALGGHTEGGQAAVKDTRTDEEKDEAYTKEFLDGKVNPFTG